MASTVKSRQRSKTQQAIVELRKARQMTQQALAIHMGRTTTTIGRWEAIRPPRGFSLVELAKVARDFERKDLAEIFERELQRESALMASGGRGLEALAHHIGMISPLETAVKKLFQIARADSSRRSVAYREYRKVRRAIADSIASLLREACQGRLIDVRGPNLVRNLEQLQIEIEAMEEEEEKHDARK